MVIVYMRCDFARDQDSEGIARPGKGPGFRRDSATGESEGLAGGDSDRGIRRDGRRG